MGGREMRRIFCLLTLRKGQLGRPKHRWKYNVKSGMKKEFV